MRLSVSKSLLKALTVAAIAAAAGTSQAAIISSYNFNSFTNGNLGTDLTGVTAGQGGWYTFSGSGTNADFSIVADPLASGRGKSLKVNGPVTGNISSKFAWTNDVANNFGSNNHITAFFDFGYATSTSTARAGGVIYDATGAKILAGTYVQPSTGQMYLLANYNNAGTIGNFAFSLTGAILTANTWYSMVVDFDVASGKAIAGYAAPGATSYTTFFVDGAAAGTNPDEFDLYATRNAATTASSFYYDNVSVDASTVVVPEPTALGLLPVAGLLLGRRRK